MRFVKAGRFWYSTRKEADSYRKKGEIIYYDPNMKAYYFVKPRKSFWEC